MIFLDLSFVLGLARIFLNFLDLSFDVRFEFCCCGFVWVFYFLF